MRPRKSSTLIKKGQSLLKTKQGFKNEQKKIERVQNNFIPTNNQLNKNVNLKNSNLISNTSMNRTFLRQTKAHSLVDKKITSTANNSKTNNNVRIIKQNSIEQKIVDSRLWENQKQEKGKQKIIKTPIRNIAQSSLHQQKITKSKVLSVTNPEQKKINPSNYVRNQMLNTRRSKFETDSNLRNLKKQQQKIKTNNIRSRNISIHPVKNTVTKNSIKKQQQKAQKKNDSLVQIEGNNDKLQKIEEKSQPLNQQRSRQQQQNVQTSTLNQNRPQRISTNDLVIQPERQIENPVQRQVEQRPFNRQQDQYHNLQISNPSRIQQPVIAREQQRTNVINNLPVERQPPQRQQQNTIQNQQNQRNIDLASLISNTQDIIDFINRLNLNNRIQTFDLMVGQLVQLNLIAQQVHQLGQIGNNLGYSLVNVFGTRIRELQTTIINQVGIALITSFSERIDPQFQALVIRQPSLRSGFSKADIQKTFDEKLTFQEVECSICLENVKQGERVIELQCHHEFHPICIKTWLQNSKKCPLCRAQQQRKTN